MLWSNQWRHSCEVLFRGWFARDLSVDVVKLRLCWIFWNLKRRDFEVEAKFLSGNFPGSRIFHPDELSWRLQTDTHTHKHKHTQTIKRIFFPKLNIWESNKLKHAIQYLHSSLVFLLVTTLSNEKGCNKNVTRFGVIAVAIGSEDMRVAIQYVWRMSFSFSIKLKLNECFKAIDRNELVTNNTPIKASKSK